MRKPMVTRTFKGMNVTVMGVDVKTAEVENRTVTLARVIKDRTKLLKTVKEAVETDTYKVADIVDTAEVETCYGMSEQDFIKYAQVLDPETRKAIESDSEATDEE